MKTYISIIISAQFLFSSFLFFSCKKGNNIKKAVAIISSKSDSGISGTVNFMEKDGKVNMKANISSTTQGIHAIHIHAIGDCSAADGTSAGGHWNPTSEAHGKWNTPPFHRGDIGNIEVDSQGKGAIDLEATDLWCIGCDDERKNILNKSIIVHAMADDFAGESGNAGKRIGCGVITKN